MHEQLKPEKNTKQIHTTPTCIRWTVSKLSIFRCFLVGWWSIDRSATSRNWDCWWPSFIYSGSYSVLSWFAFTVRLFVCCCLCIHGCGWIRWHENNIGVPWLSGYLSIHPSIHSSIHPSIYTYIHISSIHPSIFSKGFKFLRVTSSTRNTDCVLK